jgi:hypothetical protein
MFQITNHHLPLYGDKHLSNTRKQSNVLFTTKSLYVHGKMLKQGKYTQIIVCTDEGIPSIDTIIHIVCVIPHVSNL